MILFNAKVVVDGTDLSNQCRQLTVPGGREMKPDNAFGDSMMKSAGGAKNGTLTARFRQSFLAGGVHSILQGLLDANVPFEITVVPDKDAVVSADNPQGVGMFIIEQYTGLDAAWAEMNDAVVTFRSAEGADFEWTIIP